MTKLRFPVTNGPAPWPLEEIATRNRYDVPTYCMMRAILDEPAAPRKDGILLLNSALNLLHMKVLFPAKRAASNSVRVEEVLCDPSIPLDNLNIVYDLARWARRPGLSGYQTAIEARIRRLLYNNYGVV